MVKLQRISIACVLAALVHPALAADRPDAKKLEFFEKKIRPVLVKHCYSCHSAKAKTVRGKLLLDSRDANRKGGESGPAVVPGDVKKSLLIDAIRYESFEMPPKQRLPKNVVADFERWIKDGAVDPRTTKAGGPRPAGPACYVRHAPLPTARQHRRRCLDHRPRRWPHLPAA